MHRDRRGRLDGSERVVKSWREIRQGFVQHTAGADGERRSVRRYPVKLLRREDLSSIWEPFNLLDLVREFKIRRHAQGVLREQQVLES